MASKDEEEDGQENAPMTRKDLYLLMESMRDPSPKEDDAAAGQPGPKLKDMDASGNTITNNANTNPETEGKLNTALKWSRLAVNTLQHSRQTKAMLRSMYQTMREMSSWRAWPPRNPGGAP